MGTPRPAESNPVKMKVLLLSATLALASAGFASSCEECNAAAAGLLARLTSADSIAEQTGILISQVCPQAADAAACEAGLSQWWGDMAMCLYPAFIGAGDACEQLGLCKVKSVLGDWTCDDCTDCRVSRPGEQPGRALHAGPVCCADGDDTRAVPGYRWCLLTQLFLVFPPINK